MIHRTNILLMLISQTSLMHNESPTLEVNSLVIMIFYNSSLVILSLVFNSSFKQCWPLGSSYLVGRV